MGIDLTGLIPDITVIDGFPQTGDDTPPEGFLETAWPPL